jgi:beta-glucosidase
MTGGAGTTAQLEEKAAVTAGSGPMSTTLGKRLGIPQINLTDGPNGARVPHYPGLAGPSSTCVPCESAIRGHSSTVVAQQLGFLVGREALDRGYRGLPPLPPSTCTAPPW